MANKIINNPDHVVSEMMEGFIDAYAHLYEHVPDTVGGVLLKARRKDKVSIVFGGGSGHEPTFCGFVGKGLADGAACGNVFASPDPGTICAVAQAVDSGSGVLFLYGNYAGDNLNFDMAEELLEELDIKTAHVRVKDDCASAPPERKEDRRGIAGDFFALKVAGAASDAGLSLQQVEEVTNCALENLRTIGVATAPGSIPGVLKPAFELGENEIEFGLGIHGERGIQRTELMPADELVDVMYERIVTDMPLVNGDEVAVLVNGLGSTTIMEMSIAYRRLKQRLKTDGVSVYDANINSYCTTMEMGGFSISLLKLNDEIKQYLDAPCHCPYYTKESRATNE